MRAKCSGHTSFARWTYVTEDAYQWRMQAWIYKQSLGFFLKGNLVGKKCLALRWQRSTGIYGVCVCLVRSRVESEQCAKKDYGSQKRWQITESDSTSCGMLAQHESSWYTKLPWLEEQRAGASQGAAATQQHAKNAKSQQAMRLIQRLCHDATIQHKFLQWKLKAALLRQQPWRTFDTVAADVSVCFLINRAD